MRLCHLCVSAQCFRVLPTARPCLAYVWSAPHETSVVRAWLRSCPSSGLIPASSRRCGHHRTTASARMAPRRTWSCCITPGCATTKRQSGNFASPASEVSAHYLVLEDGYIIQMVPESRRAWHAGASSWAGETDINSCSIGIEIANPGHDHGYPDFPRRQIAAVTALCRSILTRHQVPADRVLAHSDVAPARKQDPGEKFPWKVLADSGIGLWVKPAPLTPDGPIFVLGETDPVVEETQQLLARYGYAVTPSGYLDGMTRDAVAAFQRHFRPIRVDGVHRCFNDSHVEGPARCARSAEQYSPAGSEACEALRYRHAPPLTAAVSVPMPYASVGWTAARAHAERWPGRKVRAPWTYGAG